MAMGGSGGLWRSAPRLCRCPWPIAMQWRGVWALFVSRFSPKRHANGVQTACEWRLKARRVAIGDGRDGLGRFVNDSLKTSYEKRRESRVRARHACLLRTRDFSACVCRVFSALGAWRSHDVAGASASRVPIASDGDIVAMGLDLMERGGCRLVGKAVRAGSLVSPDCHWERAL